MAQDTLPRKRIAQRSMWFNVLLLLDAFVLGGLVAMKLVHQLLESIMNRSIGVQSEILNVLDHLIPYWLGYIGVLLLLGLITVGAYVWLRIG